MSHGAIHIVPILNGNIIYNELKRINVGVGNTYDILYKSLNLKFPHVKNFLNSISVSYCHRLIIVFFNYGLILWMFNRLLELALIFFASRKGL